MAEQLEYSISLESLKLENFRCFDNLEINFEEKLTVFIAQNGGGKTTLLDTITENLKTYLSALGVDGYKPKPIAFKDIKEGELSARCEISTEVFFVKEDTYIVEIENGVKGEPYLKTDELITTLKEQGKKEKEDYEEEHGDDEANTIQTFSIESKKHLSKSESYFYDHAKLFKNYFERTNIPVLVYYPGDSVKVVLDSKEETSFDKLDMVYSNALNPARFSFTPFYNWYKHNEDKALRIPKKNSPEFRTIDSQLQKIRAAIEFIMNDNDDSQPKYSNLRLNEELKMGMDKKQKDNEGNIIEIFVEISQFSAGELALFAFVADLGLRLLHATPLVMNPEVNDVVADDKIGVINGKGIVLIDEVDLHLHPQWQRKVVDKLLTIFPNVQFIMTTHSPFVLSNIHIQNARVIKDQKCYMVKELLPDFVNYGANLEKIVSLLFGLSDYMPKEVSDLFDDYFDAINNSDLVKAKKIERQLQQITDPKHPKIIQGRAEIEFKELIAEGI